MNTRFSRSLADLSSRWRSRFSRSKKLSEHLRLGARGEKLACAFLRRQGYRILYRNFRARRGGEVDIICRDRDTLGFLEDNGVAIAANDTNFFDTARPQAAISNNIII